MSEKDLGRKSKIITKAQNNPKSEENLVKMASNILLELDLMKK